MDGENMKNRNVIGRTLLLSLLPLSLSSCSLPENKMNLQRVEYVSAVDGRADWYLRYDAGEGRDCVVVLHGHGAHGDQLFSRPDVAPALEYLTGLGCSLICPNLLDNAWMNPAAVSDLAAILIAEKARMRFRRCIVVGASMGGTGALIFAVIRPELVDGLVILGAATGIRRYRDWCAAGDLPIHNAIWEAIDAGYTEAELDRHDVCANWRNLTMPMRFYHSEADRVIPVSEMRELRRVMGKCASAKFTEVPPLAEAPNWWSDHDAPVRHFSAALDEILKILRSEKDR